MSVSHIASPEFPMEKNPIVQPYELLRVVTNVVVSRQVKISCYVLDRYQKLRNPRPPPVGCWSIGLRFPNLGHLKMGMGKTASKVTIGRKLFMMSSQKKNGIWWGVSWMRCLWWLFWCIVWTMGCNHNVLMKFTILEHISGTLSQHLFSQDFLSHLWFADSTGVVFGAVYGIQHPYNHFGSCHKKKTFCNWPWYNHICRQLDLWIDWTKMICFLLVCFLKNWIQMSARDPTLIWDFASDLRWAVAKFIYNRSSPELTPNDQYNKPESLHNEP